MQRPRGEPAPEPDFDSQARAAMNDLAWVDLLGYCAASLTTASFVPQAWLTFRTGDVSGISLGMYASFTVGVALWLGYGVMLGAWPIVVANAITLALAASILVMKLRGGRSRGPPR